MYPTNDSAHYPSTIFLFPLSMSKPTTKAQQLRLSYPFADLISFVQNANNLIDKRAPRHTARKTHSPEKSSA